MKILYVVTVGGTMNFFKDFIRDLIKDKHTVDIMCNRNNSPALSFFEELGCKVYDVNFSRSPLSRGNFEAIKKIKQIVVENSYDVVHCHTPVAAMCTRLACKKLRKKGLRVIYTAHGFHFYKGAPLKNWLIFYPIEKICARYTDTLITINTEDYELAKRKMKAKQVIYVPGVGIDIQKIEQRLVDKKQKRVELGVPGDKKLLLSLGELNANKNHETVIRAIKDMDDVYYVIAGKGPRQKALEKLIEELGACDKVKLLGYRTDAIELCSAADLYVFPSFREGLSVSLMEAMASGLPVACSKIRGNVDLIDENGGALFDPHSVEDCRVKIEKILNYEAQALGLYNKNKVRGFSYNAIREEMTNILSGTKSVD